MKDDTIPTTITIVKVKKDVPTVIQYAGRVYALVHPSQR